MTERRLYLVRHGQRIDTVDKNWHTPGTDPHDPYLSDRGHWQAARLAERLRDEPIDVMLASPYTRTLQTAQHIASALDLPFFIEAGVGEWQAKNLMQQPPELGDLAERAAHYSYANLTHAALHQPTYPESKQDVEMRYAQTIRDLLALYPGNLLLVAHGKLVTAGAAALSGQAEYKMRYGVAGLTLLTRPTDAAEDAKWHLAINGDTQHLEGQHATLV